jgi:hypothetical protein
VKIDPKGYLDMALDELRGLLRSEPLDEFGIFFTVKLILSFLAKPEGNTDENCR